MVEVKTSQELAMNTSILSDLMEYHDKSKGVSDLTLELELRDGVFNL